MKWNRQYIVNSTLKGEHGFLDDRALRLNWSAVASKAYNETPDNAEVGLLDGGKRVATPDNAEVGLLDGGKRVAVNEALVRRWEHNSDRDFAGYLDLMYKLNLSNGSSFDFSVGGMYRDKKRDSYFNEYKFRTTNGDPQIKGEDWNNFDEIVFPDVSSRNISGALNYDATEKIGAGYGMVKYTWSKWELIAGVRVPD